MHVCILLLNWQFFFYSIFRSFGIASKAFIKLSLEPKITENKRFEYEELAVNIFSKFEPFDTSDDHTNKMRTCNICESKIFDW
jgi:WD repeat-containing protein 35